MNKRFYLILFLILTFSLFGLEKPVVILNDLAGHPNIDECSRKGEISGVGRIMLYPTIELNGYQFDSNKDSYWKIIEGKSKKTMAGGTINAQTIPIFKTWLNNIYIWLESHFEIWNEHGYENCKLGFRINNIEKPIYLIFQIEIHFLKNSADNGSSHYGIWQKEFNGVITIHETKRWGEIAQSNTNLIEHNFEVEEPEPPPPPPEPEEENGFLEEIIKLIGTNWWMGIIVIGFVIVYFIFIRRKE